MIRSTLILVMIFCLGSISLSAQSKGESNVNYNKEIVIVKLLASYSDYFQQPNYFTAAKLNVQAMFPNHSLNKLESNQVDLSLIFAVTIPKDMSVQALIMEASQLNVFEYVEQKVIHQIDFVPNDPSLNDQSYLTQVAANSAWDITSGSTNVKVGIVDSGTDMDHPDLVTEMYENSGDPINGIDDDNDGYIDNFYGWDFYQNDNDPQIGDNAHGIHVAGISAAATNNNEGVASVGYSSQFMPIRAGNGVAITHGYEGVIYAADMGCDVINCSWGSFGFTSFGQDAVNYATYNKDALVVAAGGNSGLERLYYPAGYENVLGVVSVNSADGKSSFSNYGNWAGISAPGENIYSCVDAGLYNYNTGTSMASPVVAGAAALLKSVFPQLTAKQLAERLKTTSADVSAQNLGLDHKMGYGRLHVNNAVSGTINEGSVVFENKRYSNKTDNVFKAGDSLLISGTFTNYLAPSNTVVATLTSSSPYVTLNMQSLNLGSLPSLVQLDNYVNPFSCKIDPAAPINTKVSFELTLTDGVFTNTQIIDVLVNVDYLNIAINNMATTLGSVGQFGYNTRNQAQGLGLQFKNGGSQLFEGGLMIGTNDGNFTRVMDRVRNGANSWDDDFQVVENIKEINPAAKGEYEVQGIFNDSNGLANSIGLSVKQTGYASTEAGHENYVVLEYVISNTSNDRIENVSVGVFADFDVANYDKNAAYTEVTKVYTYTISTEPGSALYGVQLLTPTVFRSYTLDNIPGGAGGIDINSGFSNSDKFITLNSNRYGSGFTDIAGNDVIQVTATGGFDLNAGDSVKVAFALIAAESKSLLDQVADSAYMRYNGSLPNGINAPKDVSHLVEVFPNPVNHTLHIDMEALGNVQGGTIQVMDMTGRTLRTLEIGSRSLVNIDFSLFKSGVYFIDIQTSQGVSVIEIIKN